MIDLPDFRKLHPDALRLLLGNPATAALIATGEGDTALFHGAGGYFVLKRSPVGYETEFLTLEQAKVWAAAMDARKAFKDNAKQDRLFTAHLLDQVRGESARRADKEAA